MTSDMHMLRPEPLLRDPIQVIMRRYTSLSFEVITVLKCLTRKTWYSCDGRRKNVRKVTRRCQTYRWLRGGTEHQEALDVINTARSYLFVNQKL